MSTNTKDEIKSTIMRAFNGFGFLPDTKQYQLECSKTPKLDNDFYQLIEDVFVEEFCNSEIISNFFDDSTGYASYISSYNEKYGVSCYLLICHFYPVATLRVAPDWMIVESGSSQWDFVPKDKGRLKLISQLVNMDNVILINNKMLRTQDSIVEILSLYNYLFLPWNSPEFNQEIRFCFRKNKAWDYIFYLGVPTGW
jgi:hypothetical protein